VKKDEREEKMLIDETIESIKQIKGSVKAVALQTDKIYIELRKVENGVALVEEEMEKMGFPFRYSTLKSPNDLVPLSIRVASLLAIKKVFHLEEEQIKDMGRFATKNSFFTKLTLRYLVSLKKMAKEIPRYWQRHYTVGSMDPAELYEDERYFIVRLRDFNAHPIFCTYLSGYILGVVELIGSFATLAVNETTCQHRGDEYHEFRVTWI
jgi:predicted hydrocarbon binding protein